MKALQADVPDVPLLYNVALPHTNTPVAIHRAMCFTGTRFANAFKLSQQSEERDRAGALAKRKRGPERQCDAVAAAPDPDAPEAKGMQLLAEILNGEPRTQLSCAEAAYVVAAAAYGNATHISTCLPAYLRPLLLKADLSEVRAQQPQSTLRMFVTQG